MTATALRDLAQRNRDAADYLASEYDDTPALVAALHLSARAAGIAAFREEQLEATQTAAHQLTAWPRRTSP